MGICSDYCDNLAPAKKGTKICNARAQSLFGSLELLFGGVLGAGAVAVVVCFRSILFPNNA